MRLGRRRLLQGGSAAIVAFALGCSEDDRPALDDPPRDFGDPIPIGTLEHVRGKIADGDGVHYAPEARAYVVEVPDSQRDAARAAYADVVVRGIDATGLLALYQKCTHLGCRVPECVTSQWFECACHGAMFDHAGDWRAGPAPRGLDRFAIALVDGQVVIDTSVVLEGTEKGTEVADDAAGPHCVGP